MSQGCNCIKKRLWYKCFHINIAKFLRTPFFIEHLRWLFWQKHSPGNVLQKRCSKKFCKINRKTLVSEFLFQREKETPTQVLYYEFCKKIFIKPFLQNTSVSCFFLWKSCYCCLSHFEEQFTIAFFGELI